MQHFFKIAYIGLAIFIFYGCGSSNISSSKETKSEQPQNSIGAQDSQLEYISSITAVTGNKNSNIVIIDLQGGPTTTLDKDPHGSLLRTSIEDIESQNGVKVSAQYKLFVNSMIVAPHQHQTKYPELYAQPIDFETAKQYGAKSTKMLSDVVSYYKKLGKKVYIIGTSYGAFLAQNFIEYTHKNNLAKPDGYLIVVGRLDMNEEVWKSFSLGHSRGFIDGVTPTKEKMDNTILESNMYRLSAAFGQKRYTQLLADIPLDNLLYAYGEKDQAVGRLSDAEADFLRSKNAKVLKVENADHGTASSSSLLFSIDILLKSEVK